MHRIGGFNHFPTAEGTLGDIIERASARGHEEGKYGVQMDEFTDLIDEEDFFDGSNNTGPDPAIEEILKCHVPYVDIPLDVVKQINFDE